MTEPWLIYFFIFAAVFLGVQFSYQFLARDVGVRRHVNRRLAEIESGAYDPGLANGIRRAPGGGRGALAAGVETLARQAGVKAPLSKLLLIAAGACLGSVALASLFFRLGVAVPLGVFGSAAGLFATLRIMRARRTARFAEQLPDVLDVIVRSLRAGHPFPVSIGLVAREMPDPAGSEFGAMMDEITYGRDIPTALENLCERVAVEDLVFLSAAVSVQVQTGGNLGEILSRLSSLIRERFKMRRKARALSSEGRFSAVALSSFPVIMFGMLNVLSPTYYGQVWGQPAFNLALMCCALLLIVGNIVMYKMVNFKV